MITRITTWIAICSGLIFSSGLYAQETPTIVFGQSVSGSASSKGGDLYQFIGLSGTQIQANLSLPGSGFLTLYSPDGEELLRTEGKSNIELKTRLNENAMYFIGVIRTQPGAAYSLTLKGLMSYPVAPTPAEESTAAPAVAAADPAVWGLYAQLLGQHRQAKGGYKLHWRWETPQQVLVEEWINPATGKVAHTHTLHPGTAPGSLELDASYLGGDRSGKVTADGSVEFLGKGFFKHDYRAQLAPNGDFEMLTLQIRDGVAKVTGAQRFSVLDH